MKSNKPKGKMLGPVFKVRPPDFKGMKEMYRKKLEELGYKEEDDQPPTGEALQEAKQQDDASAQEEAKADKKQMPVSQKEKALSKTKPLGQKSDLMQGKHHAENPWIQEMNLREVQSVKRPLSKDVPKKEPDSGTLSKPGHEADIMAKEFKEPLFEIMDRKECRQLPRYDTWESDLPPEEWIKRCKESKNESHARSPVYHGKTISWDPVQVVAYDVKEKKFRVIVVESGQVKFVNRLALVFDDEDQSQFNARLKQCRERREIVEGEVRFMELIDNQSTEVISAMPKAMIEEIKESIGSQLRKDEHEKKRADIVMTRLLPVIEAIYRRTMKKCYVLKEMSIPKFFRKYEDMRFPIKFNKTAVPFLGTIDIWKETGRSIIQAEFENSLRVSERPSGIMNPDEVKMKGSIMGAGKTGNASTLGASGAVTLKKKKRTFIKRKQAEENLAWQTGVNSIGKFTGEFQKMCEAFKKSKRMFQCDTSRLQLPMRLHAFIGLQEKKIKSTQTDILNNWRFQILHDMKEQIASEEYVFDVRDLKEYEESRLKRLIRKYDLMFRHHLNEFFGVSISEFCQFVAKFTKPKTQDKPWKISGLPLLEIDIRYPGSEKAKEIKKEDLAKKKHKRDDKKKKEIKKKEPKNLFFKPEIEQCKADILSLLEKVNQSASAITILETDEFNAFLGGKKQASFQFDMPGTTNILVIAKDQIAKMIDECMVGPKELLAKFKKYEYLLDVDTTELRDLMKKSPSIETIRQKLDDYSRASYEVQTLSTDLVQFSMFQINATMVKQYLAHRAEKLKGIMVHAIQKYCSHTIQAIETQYKEMISRLDEKPTSKTTYKELKMQLRSSQKTNEELKEKHEKVKAHIEILEDHLMEIDKDDESGFWRIYRCPGQLRMKAAKGGNNLSTYEETLKIELDKKKDLFDRDLGRYQTALQEVIVFNDIESAKAKFRSAAELHDGIEKAVNEAKSINDYEELLEIKKTEYQNLDKLGKEFPPFYSLIEFSDKITGRIEEWKTNPFVSLKPSEIKEDINKWLTSMEMLAKQLEETKEQADVAEQLKGVVQEFNNHFDLIKCLNSEAMKEDEYIEINKATNLEIKFNDQTLTLNLLLKKNAEQYMEQITEIWEKAEKKLNLDKQLRKLRDDISKRKLDVVKYKETCFIIQGYDSVLEAIDDQLTDTQIMLSSPYMSGQLRKNTQLWAARLSTLSETLEELRKCQKTWQYLEPLFSAVDIKLALKGEAERFAEVHEKYKTQMESINADPQLLALLEKDRPKEEFMKANESLDNILKSMSDFLESVRKKFPRLYFISDDDLVRILSCAKQDPSAVNPYVEKIFEGISSLEVVGLNQDLLSISSHEGEKVALIRPISLKEGDRKGNVEIWMKVVEKVLGETICELTQKSVKEYKVQSKDHYDFKTAMNFPGQVSILTSQIMWTYEVETILRSQKPEALQMYYDKMNNSVQAIVEYVRGEIPQLHRLTFEAFLVLQIHAKDILHLMNDKAITSDTSFDWIAQMRYYMEKDEIKVRMGNAVTKYGFEYYGAPTRLVLTPLTDACFRTLMSAKHMCRGGAPEGPAGSGKTETVKDLAKALGIQCIVFNGSDELDPMSMGKFFKGIASAGAWCCFDEFNRIDLDVLSVIASQILMIQQALSTDTQVFHFTDEDICLNPQCGINITMNPNYPGRSILPDNLKALFRPYAMTMPDTCAIAEILLYSYGFQDARSLAKKLSTAMQLCTDQLSAQSHYDFGMRALKSIVMTARALKKLAPLEKEDVILKKAIDEVNIPKFTSYDMKLYLGIASDLFPGIEGDAETKGIKTALEEMLKGETNEEKLQAKPEFIKKCTELFQTMEVRHGVMVIGEAYSGKTKAIECLMKSSTYVKDWEGTAASEVTLKTLNPKAVSFKQLYGYFDNETHTIWSDGVLPMIIREFNELPSNQKKWLVFDGPVDTIWMESMNSVLDDNKKLCLSSGTAIKLTPNTSMLFEVEDLKHASPAIVSRCGMVFMESKQLGWEVLVKTYCEKLPAKLTPKRIKSIEDYIFSLITPTLNFVTKHGKFSYVITPMVLVKSFLDLFESFIVDCRSEAYKIPNDIDTMIPHEIIFSAVWGFGGCLESSSRDRFHEFLYDLLNAVDVKMKYKLDPGLEFNGLKFSAKIKQAGNIFELGYDHKKLSWYKFMESAENIFATMKANVQYSEIIVPTIESMRMNYLQKQLIPIRKHLLIVGPTGTGKTICSMAELKKSCPKDQYAILPICLTAQTTSTQIQRIIESKMEKRGKMLSYGPVQNKKGVVFIDDLNMPQKDQYGAQPPLELLRQWMDYSGWYDIDSAEKKFKTFIEISFVAAMAPPSAGRQAVSNRFIRHYNIIYIDNYDEATVTNMFKGIMNWSLSNTTPAFSSSVLQLTEKIVKATVESYMALSKELRPTPSKCHYTYNLRDVSKVFQGICRVSALAIKTEDDLIKLWAHECIRIFQDRLISQQDRDIYMKILKGVMKSNLNKEWETLVVSEPLIFTSFVPCIFPEDDKSKPPLTNIYCEVANKELLKQTTEEKLQKYNEAHKSNMQIVLFMNAIEHITKILRIISLPTGHCLLIGIGGSGRKSLASLAAFIGGFHVSSIDSTSKKYRVIDWHNDLRSLMKITGVDSIKTMFMLSDSQLDQHTILEDINNLLNTGEVPNLYAKMDASEGREDYLAKLKENMLANKIKITQDDILDILRERSKENLHIMLCLSPIGELFKQRLRMYPSLINCTTIDWFLPWPEEGLRSVASQFLVDVEEIDKEKEGIISVCVDMQERVRAMTEKYKSEMKSYYYVTPTSYLELLKVFKKLLLEKRKEMQSRIKSYEIGLEEMQRTEAVVGQMKAKLQAIEPELKTKNESAMQLAESLKKKQAEVSEETKVVQKEEEKATEMKKVADALQEECKADLDKALPELKEAEKDVGNINQVAISELLNMASPPDELKLVAKALCIALDIKGQKVQGTTELNYWIPKKIFTFKLPKNLLNMDKENIPAAKITELKKIIDSPDFATARLSAVSPPGETLARWVRALIKFDQVNKEIAPKKEKLKEESDKALKAQEFLMQKSKQLEEKRNLLSELNTKAQNADTQKKQLAQEIDLTVKKINRAKELVELLKSEGKRWGDQRLDLQNRYKSMLGDLLISAGIIAYLGVFPASYRDSCIDSWSELMQTLNICKSEKFSLQSVLGDPLQKLQWQTKKLPSDPTSVDNAIILERSSRFPLMIDPQRQAADWIKRGGKVEVIKKNQKIEFVIKRIEYCMMTGNCILLEDVEENIHSNFDPVLKMGKYEEGKKQTVLKLGEDSVTVNKNFMLYLTTKLARPHFSPEICSKVVMLNFLATEEGLVDQMLNIIVKKEEPKKEGEKEENINKSYEIKKRLKGLEEEILKNVTTHKESILGDDKLLEALKTTKSQCQNLSHQVEEQKRISDKIEVARNQFKGVAKRVASLYFTVSELSNVEAMYQFSLDWYQELYLKALQEEKETDRSIKLENYKTRFTSMLFTTVCKSLFEKDKFLFSFSILIKIMLSEGEITLQEVRFLASGPTSLDASGYPPNPSANTPDPWISEGMWKHICEMAKILPCFKDIDKDFIANIADWKKLANANDFKKIMSLPWPSNWAAPEKLNVFQRLIVISALRIDKFLEAAQGVIAERMGPEFMEYPLFNLEEAFTLSTHKIPIIVISSPGADPLEELRVFAEKKNLAKCVMPISLGKGQEKKADQIIEHALNAKEGGWVIMQNCHLAPNYLTELEKKLDEIPEEPKRPFRLWLTSMPTDKFPVSLLQSSVKITNEPPKGIVRNMIRSYNSVVGNRVSESELGKTQWKKLLFGLCLFHANILERRKFGSLGWNNHYEFSAADLAISIDQLRLYLLSHEEIQWDALNYIITEENYGGRITDPMDKRLLKCVFTDFFSPEILSSDNYKFCGVKEYSMPKDLKDKDEYISYIKRLPMIDMPEIFGLHESASFGKTINETKLLYSMIVLLLPRTGAEAVGSMETEVSKKCQQLIKEIPSKLSVEDCERLHPITYADCLSPVLHQEIHRYNKLISVIQKTLADLDSAVKGYSIMLPEIEAMAMSIYNNNVPVSWQNYAYPSQKPLSSWFRDLIARVKFYKDWIEKGNPGSYWLATFYFAEAFITAVKQNFARKKTIAYDTIEITHSILDQSETEKKSDEDGALINGIYLEGAKWSNERKCLENPELKATFWKMPLIKLMPIAHKSEDKGKKTAQDKYECPVYKISKRSGGVSINGNSTLYIMSIDVPISGKQTVKEWIKKGVAMITQINE